MFALRGAIISLLVYVTTCDSSQTTSGALLYCVMIGCLASQRSNLDVFMTSLLVGKSMIQMKQYIKKYAPRVHRVLSYVEPVPKAPAYDRHE